MEPPSHTSYTSHTSHTSQVDHLYTPNSWAAYCSEVSPNVNTLAYLKVWIVPP